MKRKAKGGLKFKSEKRKYVWTLNVFCGCLPLRIGNFFSLRALFPMGPSMFSEQATTRVRQLAQIYDIYASASALPACLSQIIDTNFPQTNLTMKPTNQDCKTHETKKIIIKLQDPWKQQSWNLRVWHVVFFGLVGFLGFPCLGHRYRPKMHKQHHYTPGLSFI